jgi:hypothetical protein
MGNAERIDATTGSIHQLQASLAAAQATLGSGGGDQGLLASFLGFQFVADGSAASMDNAQSAVDAYQKAIADLEAKQNMASDTADVLAGKMGMTRDEVLQLADAAGVDLSQGLGTAQGQLLMYRDAQDAASGSTAAASSTAEVFATNMEGVKQSADDAKTATDNFKLSLDILTGAHITLAEAQSAMYAALDQATSSLSDQERAAIAAAGSLDLTTEAGRKGQQTLIDIKDAGNQYISTMIQQGATAADVQAADAQLRDSFVKSAMQMGLSQQAAETYADQILGIPADRTTKINADVAAAQNAISNTQTQIDNLHGKTVTITMTANGTVAAILGDPNQAHSRGTVIGYAEGGYTGPGSKYQPAGIVHAGEFVFTQEQTRKAGISNLSAMATALNGYAGGGYVDPIQWGEVSSATWRRLLGQGWHGRPGDRMEALYPPERVARVRRQPGLDRRQ